MPETRSLRFLMLACDYDGTLAKDGRVSPGTIGSLERFVASGRKLVLVTGRELDDLQRTFDRLDLFDRVVAENGALLYNPAQREEKALADPPPLGFVPLLQQRGVTPISVGRVIVATWRPHETAVMDTIRDLGLELQVIFNKGAVMVLPSGVNKRTGLDAALRDLGFSLRNTAGVGDAENDHAFLNACECSVVVANALPALRETADLVTAGDHGVGVQELVDLMLSDDLVTLEPRLERHWVPIGRSDAGEEIRLRPFGQNVMVAGTSGSGKTTLTTGFIERVTEAGYQICHIDPEGDFEMIEGVVGLGDRHRCPSEDEVIGLLRDPRENVSVRLVGLSMADRPAFFSRLLPRLLEMRAHFGRPHVILLDETHHLLPSTWDPAVLAVPARLDGLFMITVHPEHLAAQVVEELDVAIVLGKAPAETMRAIAARLPERAVEVPAEPLETGRAIVWDRRAERPPIAISFDQGRTERRRHIRKYAEGELPPERSFFFRGPNGKLNLQAQNLFLFVQIGDGVDDATWLHHLHRGDYSRWFREKIKDDDLSAAAGRIERDNRLSARESRALIRKIIEDRYRLPA